MISIFLALATQAEAPVAATQAYPLPPAAAIQPLLLTCHGAGTANKQISDTVRRDKKVDGPPGSKPTIKTETVTVSRNIQQDFADQVDVRLFMGDDRIRVPRTMLPDLHGGNQGWFKIKDVTGDARSIRGSIALAFLNNPKLFIDRVTGIISISGKAGDYRGQCEPFDPNAQPRF